MNRLLSRACLALVIWFQAQLALAIPPPPGQAATPGIRSASGTLISPGQALPAYDLNSPALTEPVHPILVSLARRLDNNPDRIFEFVHNKIEYVPMFGITKGGLGAYLNEAGTAFDQAELMRDLLRAANVPVRLRLGEVTLNPADTASLFGSANSAVVTSILADGGIPGAVTGAPTVTAVSLLHVWVEAQIGGTWYAFDPAIKAQSAFAGDNLWSASGVTSTGIANATFASSVETTINGVAQITGANKTALRAELAARAAAFETVMSTPAKLRTASIELLGGMEVQPRFRTSDRFTTNPRQSQFHATWTGAIPDGFRVQISVSACNALTYFADEQFKVQFTPGYHDPLSSNPVHPAWSDQVAYDRFLRLKSDVPVDILSCITGAETKKPFEVAIDHPYAASSGNYSDVRYKLDSAIADRGPGLSSAYQTTMSEIIRIDVGVSSDGVNEIIREWYKDSGTYLSVPMAPLNDANGLDDVAQIEEFFARQNTIRRLVARVLKQKVIHHHTAAFLGNQFVVFDWTPQQWSPPYKSNWTFEGGALKLVTMSSLVSVTDMSASAVNEVAAMKTLGEVSASLESLSGLSFANRVSPADLIDTHLDAGRSQKFLTVTSANYATAMTQTTSYSVGDKDLIQAYVQSGFTLVVPDRPVQSRTLRDWSGTSTSPSGGTTGPATFYQSIVGVHADGSYVALLADEMNGERYIIKGGAGNAALDGTDQIGMRDEFVTALNDGLFNTDSLVGVDPDTGKITVELPVLVASGGRSGAQALGYVVKYTDSRADSVEIQEGCCYQGSGVAAGTVAFFDQQFGRIGSTVSTTKVSSNARESLQLGFDVNLQTGSRAPRDAAALIILIQSVYALNADAGMSEGRRAVASALATTWALDQLADGIATVNLGLGGVEQFVRNPAGAYLSDPQSVAVLTRTGTPVFLPPQNKFGYRDVIFTYDNRNGASSTFRVITPKQALGNETKTDAQIVDCMGFTSASPTELLALERIFWGVEREFSITQTQTGPGVVTSFEYDTKTGCKDPGLKRVRNSFGREIAQTGTGVQVANDASDIAELHGLPIVGGGILGGCVGGSTVSPVFKTASQISGGQNCGSPSEKVSYATQNDLPLVLASAADCFVEGEYDWRLTKTHCSQQRYFVGNDPVPFTVLEVDAYGGGALSRTDALGKTTSYSIVPGYRSSVKDPYNNAVEQYYDQRGRLASALDQRDRYTEYTYDSAGRVIEERGRYISDPANTWHTRTTYAYDDIGNRIEVTVRPRTTSAGVEYSGPPLTTRYRFDDAAWKRKVTKVTDPEGYSTTMAFDANGQLIRETGPFKDTTPDITSDDPTCTSANVACKEYSYAGPFGLVSEERVRTQSGQWRRASYGYDTPANKYQLKTITQHPEGT
ncbi:MAG: hypothetical protein FP825_05405 [Hyphomonas sp.]|uniref:transglutaminase domain-containing protein n=1 Tax=Hyphomonas sp. TaxID=87 RepID=UPI0017C6E2FB|nr:transglutaminase domain-containing protein [Hyphomonas sp.]MBA3067905.1 hypothetical protein [Hyphomonas sp.]MBU3919330.1 hypothetical protein [Alphaproteobacteria bacterium]MBU4163261.1 hypothetical protein [Alphaproteobacteria bacterium]